MVESHAARRIGLALRRWAAATLTLDVRSLAAFRIGVGVILVADCLLRTRDFGLMFAPDGIFPPQTLARYHADPTLWSLAFLHDAAWWGGVVLALEGLAGAALVLGYRTRWATMLAWVSLTSVIRRTSPATNAGDIWLACLVFWSMFLPLGLRWSLDARRGGAACRGTPPDRVLSVASAALVLQVAVVYVSAGLFKCNATWFAGSALAHALSVHDHGTALGALLVRIPWLVPPLQWGVLAGEIALPVMLVLLPSARVRGTVVALFIAFHATIWMTMTVGLFAAIGIVAWLPLIPAAAWTSGSAERHGATASSGRAASLACGVALMVATCSFLHYVTPWRTRPLPRMLEATVNLLGLAQQWQMFADVPAQEQWVYGQALLADGSVVDLLRGGVTLERERPTGGFASLPHHRWHKFFWILPRPRVNMFAVSAASAVARDWNARHGPERRVVSLEIRFGMQPLRNAEAAISDTLVASWPARSPAGSGNLDRFLRDAEGEAAAPAADR
ncbi:MAG: hypothetical protein FJ284_03025 [Planctomycetes bacterium]|nr:hypothetical protein [Planctomycetota bacterium]